MGIILYLLGVITGYLIAMIILKALRQKMEEARVEALDSLLKTIETRAEATKLLSEASTLEKQTRSLLRDIKARKNSKK